MSITLPYYHKAASKKTKHEKEIPDQALYSKMYSSMWAVISDEEYHEVLETVGAISIKEASRTGSLTVQERHDYKHFSLDGVLVDKIFGRLCSSYQFFWIKFSLKRIILRLLRMFISCADKHAY